METWQETIGTAEGWQPRLVLLEKGSSVALFPLGEHREGGLRRLEWLGRGVTDYQAPLLRSAASFSPGELLSALRRAAIRLGCDLVSLDRMPSRRADGSPSLFSGHGFHRLHYGAHGLELPADLETFLAGRFSAKERYNQRRSAKKLAGLGRLEFRILDDPAERADLTDTMIAHKRMRYRATGAIDNFREPAVAEFYRKAAERPELGVELSLLSLDGRPLATHWGLARRGGGEAGVLYFLMPTFEAGPLDKYSPGKLFILRTLEALRDRGFRRLDFTIGDEEYKLKWCTDETSLYSWRAGTSPLGKFQVLLEAGLDLARASPLRKAISKLRARLRGGRPPAGAS
jgi:CelD/BcsL family acetyltransferase involved in cellulose biosynthesis